MNDIRIDAERLKEGFTCTDTNDLLHAMTGMLDYLLSHNKNYTKSQYICIDDLKHIISCFKEV